MMCSIHHKGPWRADCEPRGQAVYLALWALFSTPQILDTGVPFPGSKETLAPSPQGIRSRHKTARAVDPSVLTVEILVAGKILFASCRLRTFRFNAG